jgi:hypothetical protein
LFDSSTDLIVTLASFFVYIAITGLNVIVTYLKQEQELKEKEVLLLETKNNAVQSRITAMTGQIRAHFIFNVLNAVSGMCKTDPEKADETIGSGGNVDLLYLALTVRTYRERNWVFVSFAVILFVKAVVNVADHLALDLSVKDSVERYSFSVFVVQKDRGADKLRAGGEVEIKATARGVSLVGNAVVNEMISVIFKAVLSSDARLILFIRSIANKVQITDYQRIIVGIHYISVQNLGGKGSYVPGLSVSFFSKSLFISKPKSDLREARKTHVYAQAIVIIVNQS